MPDYFFKIGSQSDIVDRLKKVFTLTALMIFSLSYNVFACLCRLPFPCTAYSRAEAVFIGKLEKVERDKSKDAYTVNAYFSVEKTFKGKTSEVENISFLIADCDREFKVGEKYLVYKESAENYTLCNQTGLLSWAVKDLQYINNLSETHPVFNISGYIPDSTENISQPFKISVTNGRYRPRVTIDKNGLFDFTVKRKGTYHIKIILPFRVKKGALFMKNDSGQYVFPDKISAGKSSTVIEYELKFKPNDCDHREITSYGEILN